ncbi:MAG: hypothetical protein VX335_01735 [Pseudomonadota bacterium]|nr:hypothetical protein [Pseudomonadota bacterium]
MIARNSANNVNLYDWPQSADGQETFPLDGNSKTSYDNYLDKLKACMDSFSNETNINPLINKDWQRTVIELYKEIVNDAFIHFNVQWPKGMEICISGSLAKNQASPFCDLDSFVIYPNNDTKDQCQQVFEAVDNVFMRIFIDENILPPDPVGLTPKTQAGSVDQLKEFIDSENCIDPSMFKRNLSMSRSITGDGSLLVKLKRLLPITPLELYSKVKDFQSPRDGAECINLKAHITRPFDFFVTAIRLEHPDKFPSYIGDFLEFDQFIKVVQDNKLLDTKIVQALMNTNMAINKRVNKHLQHSREWDKTFSIDSDENKLLLKNVETLREYARLKTEATNDSLIPASNISLTQAPNILRTQKSSLAFKNNITKASGVVGTAGIGIGTATLLKVAALTAVISNPVAISIIALGTVICIAAAKYYFNNKATTQTHIQPEIRYTNNSPSI